jgi:hypothetical protein
VTSGSAILATLAQAAHDDNVIVADEKAALFKIRDVTLNRVDQKARTIGASFGNSDRPISLANLPLGEDVTIRVSFIEPGVVNNVPFSWERLKGLVGKRLSMMLRVESSRLTVDSFAVAND